MSEKQFLRSGLILIAVFFAVYVLLVETPRQAASKLACTVTGGTWTLTGCAAAYR